jgi:hypothetical protein
MMTRNLLTVYRLAYLRIAHAGTDFALPHFVEDGHSVDDVIEGLIELMESWYIMCVCVCSEKMTDQSRVTL